MSTVFQALQKNKGEATNKLGPVKIAAKYPAQQSKNGKWYRNIQVSDDSGKAKLTIWGAAAQGFVPDGATVVIKSPVKTNEYNGEKNLNAEAFDIEGAEGAEVSSSPSIGAPVATQRSVNMDAHELAITMAKFTMAYQAALMDQGASKEFAEKASVCAPQFGAQWFFGDKSPYFPEESGEA